MPSLKRFSREVRTSTKLDQALNKAAEGGKLSFWQSEMSDIQEAASKAIAASPHPYAELEKVKAVTGELDVDMPNQLTRMLSDLQHAADARAALLAAVPHSADYDPSF
jgi:hypothetical protein